MNMRRVFAAIPVALSVAVSTPVFAADEGQPGSAIALPAPANGKGQVVFFRPGGFAGSAVACSVHENGVKVSSLGGGRYFIMAADPGRHEFSVKTEATDTLPLEIESDETQFVACKIKMGIMVGRPDIRPSTEEEFRAQKKLRLVDTDDMGPGPGALRPDEIAAALAAQSAPAAPPAEPDADAVPAPEGGPASAETNAPAAETEPTPAEADAPATA